MTRLLLLWVAVMLSVVVTHAQTVEPIDPNQNIDLIWQHVRAQPDDFAIACMPLDNRAGTSIQNPIAPFPLASVSKVLILAEYARRVDAGMMTLGERVLLADVNRYNLPRTDRGAHDDWVDSLRPGTTSVTLWELATSGMIRYSSNAASDYMLARLGLVDWGSLFAALNMRPSTPPHPLGSIPLLMNNHETGQPSRDDVPTLSLQIGIDFYWQYMNDPVWRAAEVQYRTIQRRTFPTWDIQADILQEYTATGTVYDYINMMAVIYGEGGTLTPNTKLLIREGMRWTGNARIGATYNEYGSKLGYYSGGTLTLVAYGHAVGGGRIASVIFLRNVERRLHRDLVRQDTIGDMAHWLNLNGCGALNR